MHANCNRVTVIIIQIISSVLCQGQYSILAPGTIRSNRNYSICVALHDSPNEATIRVGIRSLSSSMHLSQEVTLKPFESKLIDFMAPKLHKQFKYELQAEGVKGIEINENYELQALEWGGPRIYVESDKGTYKPEDLVQFRVIILNEHMKVMQFVEPIRVQIMDPQKNRIKQYKDIQLQRGVFTGKFQLSKQPPLGDWTISVFISGKYGMDMEYPFKVEKYVLPKFSVHIETDRNLPRKDRILMATVYGKYTYGKYVEGTVTLTIQDIVVSHSKPPRATGVIDSNNVKLHFGMSIEQLFSAEHIKVSASLTEKHTNITVETDTDVHVRDYDYELIIPETEIEFRNKLPYRMKLYVKHWNGMPVKDTTTPAELTVKHKKYTSQLNDNGVATFEFEYEATSNFIFTYKDAIKKLDNIFAERSSDEVENTNCHLRMRGLPSVNLSTPIEIDVTANHSIPYFIYTLTSHGNIIRKEFVKVPADQKSHTIRIQPSMELVPNSYIFVHYIVDGQLRYCEFTIRLPHIFENQLSISAPTTTKPGQNITMNIKALPNSRVCIVAVDKSVLLLDSRNILDKGDIMRDLMFDRSLTLYGYAADNTYQYYPGYISGLIVFTNGIYNVHKLYRTIVPSAAEVPKSIRQLFPETWIFQDVDVDNPNTALKLQVPDTITTWIVRAFSVNDHSGFGMMEGTLDIEAFKPFFISLNLPYSVKREEVINIPITIFNYLKQNLETEIIFENAKQDFQFMDNQNKPLNKASDSMKMNVPANNGKSVAFKISPKRVGNIELHIIAKNSITSDEIIQILKVEPEGIVHQQNRDELLTLAKGQTKRTNFQADIPANIVPDSEYLLLTVSGNAMASTIENLDDLVQKPKGCGEQNMINLAPNILILDYLKTLENPKTKGNLVEKAKGYIEAGYQQQLTYRHPNGGYSVFGPDSSTDVSNWLTAYVMRFFIKGMKYSAIEPKVIQSGLKYLAGQQMDDGSFQHRGYLFEPAHQNQYGFTAFVLLAFLEDMKFAKKYDNVIQKGITFLNTNFKDINDVYSLAIMANTFKKAHKTEADEILIRLNSLAKQQNGLKWWTNNVLDEESANDVEMTSYILMALLESPGEYSPIYNWLISKRNSHGGFETTHDTVVGLQALMEYSQKSTSTSQDTLLKVHYTSKCKEGKVLKDHIIGVDSSNELILQREELPPITRSVDVEVMGHGTVYLQFSYQYYTAGKTEDMGTSNSQQPSKTSTTNIQANGSEMKPTQSETSPTQQPKKTSSNMPEMKTTQSETPPTQKPKKMSSNMPEIKPTQSETPPTQQPKKTSSNMPATVETKPVMLPANTPAKPSSAPNVPALSALDMHVPRKSEKEKHQYFIIKSKAKKATSNILSLNVCYSYQPLTVEEKFTNMVILEVQFPTGFTANAQNLKELKEDEHVSRVDNQKSATMIVIYFEVLEANDEQCLTILADKNHDVEGLKPSTIEMYDFYSPNERQSILYEIEN